VPPQAEACIDSKGQRPTLATVKRGDKKLIAVPKNTLARGLECSSNRSLYRQPSGGNRNWMRLRRRCALYLNRVASDFRVRR